MLSFYGDYIRFWPRDADESNNDLKIRFMGGNKTIFNFSNNIYHQGWQRYYSPYQYGTYKAINKRVEFNGNTYNIITDGFQICFKILAA